MVGNVPALYASSGDQTRVMQSLLLRKVVIVYYFLSYHATLWKVTITQLFMEIVFLPHCLLEPTRRRVLSQI